MNNRRILVYGAMGALAFAAFLSSCKKDEPEQPQSPGGGNPNSTSSTPFYHFPLTTGSYWIYEEEQLDANGNVTTIGATDSLFITGDSVIGSNTYKKFVFVHGPGSMYLPPLMPYLRRDSAGYLVSETGSYIRHDDFADTLAYKNYSGLINAWYFMRHPDSLVITPAGTLHTVDFEGHMYSANPNYTLGFPRFTHQLWADHVGMVLDRQYFYSSPGYVQRRLIRYHIQ